MSVQGNEILNREKEILERETEILQRIAKVEQRIEDNTAAADRRFSQMEQINAKLDRLELDLARYRGLVGGVLLVGTALVSFVKFFWADVARFFGK